MNNNSTSQTIYIHVIKFKVVIGKDGGEKKKKKSVVVHYIEWKNKLYFLFPHFIHEPLTNIKRMASSGDVYNKTIYMYQINSKSQYGPTTVLR